MFDHNISIGLWTNLAMQTLAGAFGGYTYWVFTKAWKAARAKAKARTGR